MLRLNLRTNIKELTRDLDRLSQRQIPFATARALTGVAKRVAEAETAVIRTLNNPTPFTQRAVGSSAASKTSLTATVFMRDIQAAYLAPYIEGGPQVLGGKKAILTPRDVGLNAYGNIPRGRLASLKGRPDIFVGEIRTKSGQMIGGVWQRPAGTIIAKGARGRGRGLKLNATGHLKLLIQFTRPALVTHRLPWDAVAKQTVASAMGPEWAKAWAAALATAK